MAESKDSLEKKKLLEEFTFTSIHDETVVSADRSQYLKNNWVVVRVWLPKNKAGQVVTAHEGTQFMVGHASLSAKCKNKDGDFLYASFWPSWEVGQKAGPIAATLGKAKGFLHRSLKWDLVKESIDFLDHHEKETLDLFIKEGQIHDIDGIYTYIEGCKKIKEPDVVVVLNTLNVQAIADAFLKFINSPTSKKWSLWGKNAFNMFNQGGGQSCSGLIYELLNAGGIETLANWDIIAKTMVVAPDAIARIAVEAAKSGKEVNHAANCALPPGINERVTIKVSEKDLNPHKNTIGKILATTPGTVKTTVGTAKDTDSNCRIM